MRIGVAYYPDYWPEERWPEDARLMRETGIDLVRVGEFAWSRLEPRRGEYDMGWLDRAIGVLAGEGLQVILCTPTAAPPTWLFNRHPTMMPEDQEGKKWFTGSRRHACVNNRPYRRYVRRIVREMARVFGNRPQVFGWQIDNELGCHGSGRCYCGDCEQSFREWLKRRYGTIARLNKLWGTAFWSQEFGDWHLIPAPRRTPAGAHPSLALDYERFTSASYRDFFVEQRELIEEYSGTQKPITTNCMGIGTTQINQFELGSVVEVAAYDNYPIAAERLNDTALQLDLTRSAKGRPFWVLEQQAGTTLIRTNHGQPRPGQLRLWSYQAAARGAELVSYFRWRTCPAGQEMHWYGMLDADGSLKRRYEELKQTVEELKERAHHWEGALPDAKVGLLLDYDCLWGLGAESMGTDLDYLGQFCAFYGLLRRRGLAVDVLMPNRETEGYQLIIAPMQVVGRPRLAQRWEEFVAGGGTLLVTAPAGYRTEHNTWLAKSPPGPYADVLGVEMEEHDTFIGDGGSRVVMGDEEFPVEGYCAIVETKDAEVLAKYGAKFGQHFYSATPAITRRACEQGAAYFLAAVSTTELYDRVVAMALANAGLERHRWSSESVEVIPLRAPGRRSPLTFVLNHAEEPRALAIPNGVTYRDVLTKRDYSGTLPLDEFGVVLLEG